MNKRSGEETKKKILEAGGKIFAEYGYTQANMRMIASSAGISVGCLYLYFRNKEDLCLKLMQVSLDDFNRETMKMLRGISDPRQALESFVRFTIGRVVDGNERMLMLAREHGYLAGLEIKRKFYTERRKMIENIIRDGVSKNIFRQCDVKEMSKVIFSIMRGYIASFIIDDKETLFEAGECVNLIFNGLLTRNPESEN